MKQKRIKKQRFTATKKKEQLRGNLRFNAATKKSTKSQTHKEKKIFIAKKKKNQTQVGNKRPKAEF